MNPEVSVIIPVFNTGSRLRQCMDSVLQQTFTNIECIVVDDCSSDESSVIAAEYCLRDCRVQLVRNESNMGCPLSRKAGFDRSVGNYILFIDSDDWIEAMMVEIMFCKAKELDADMIFCDYFETDGRGIRKYKKQFIENKTKNDLIKSMASYDPCLICSLWNKLIKRDVLANVSFPHENYGEDMYLSTQLVYYARIFGYVDKPLYHYIYNVDSLCNNSAYSTQRLIDQYDICTRIIAFLNDKFCRQLNIFEPELSLRINKVKIRAFLNEESRRKRDVSGLYPASSKYLFDSRLPFGFVMKLRYFIACIIRMRL